MQEAGLWNLDWKQNFWDKVLLNVSFLNMWSTQRWACSSDIIDRSCSIIDTCLHSQSLKSYIMKKKKKKRTRKKRKVLYYKAKHESIKKCQNWQNWLTLISKCTKDWIVFMKWSYTAFATQSISALCMAHDRRWSWNKS